MNKRTLLLTLVILALVAVPAVAMALSAPPRAVESPAGADGSLGWMNGMHDFMWEEGAFPDDGSLGWMDGMHDFMWEEGAFPDDGSAVPGGAFRYRPSARMGMAPPR